MWMYQCTYVILHICSVLFYAIAGISHTEIRIFSSFGAFDRSLVFESCFRVTVGDQKPSNVKTIFRERQQQLEELKRDLVKHAQEARDLQQKLKHFQLRSKQVINPYQCTDSILLFFLLKKRFIRHPLNISL